MFIKHIAAIGNLALPKNSVSRRAMQYFSDASCVNVLYHEVTFIIYY